MRKLLAIDPAVFKKLRELTKAEKAECLLALCELVEVFGHPHIHSGVGVRKLGNRLFECRATLALRFLFLVRSEDLYVCFLGNHNEIRSVLKSRKYG